MRLLPILLLTVLACAADPRDDQVIAAHNAYWSCWNTRDDACLAKLLANDFIQVPRTANRFVDKTTFLEGMKAGRYSQSKAGTAEPPERERKIRYYGNTAILTFVRPAPLNMNNPAALDHYQTEVWVSDNGGWLLASQHVSHPTPPPAPKP